MDETADATPGESRRAAERSSRGAIAPLVMPPSLRTERLDLRRHATGDFDDSLALWSDPEVVRHIGSAPSGGEQVWQRLLRYAGHWTMLGYGFYVVHERSTGLHVGEVGLADFRRDVDPPLVDFPEAGWALRPSMQGRGYAAEALGCLLQAADERLEIELIKCIIDPGNDCSVRLARRFGFDKVGPAAYQGAETMIFERRRRSAGPRIIG